MAKVTGSAICAYKTCRKPVKYTNATFPYCHFHVYMKEVEERRSQYQRVKGTTPEAMKAIRQYLYRPPYTIHRGARLTADIISSRIGVDYYPTIVAPTMKTWYKISRKIDVDDPQQCFQHRDEIVNTVADTLSKKKDNNVDTVTCHGGVAMANDGENIAIGDHRVILVTDLLTGTDFIVDPATRAPLKDVEDFQSKFSVGESTLLDNVHIAHVFEYAAFNSMDYDTFIQESNGEVLWDNSYTRSTDDSDIAATRKLLDKYGYPGAPQPSPYLYPRQNNNDEDSDLSLDQFVRKAGGAK